MIDYSRIPEGLRTIPQWILWGSVQKAKGLQAKVPTNANGERCNAHDPQNWMNFETAIQLQQRIYEQRGSQRYLGFVLTTADQIVCVDLDGCRDPITGFVAPWALSWVRFLQSYTEVSPSGTGLKIFVISTNSSYIRLTHRMPVERISEKEPKVEIFSAKQFMAVTSWVFEFDTIEDCTELIDFLVSHCPSNKLPVSGSQSPSDKRDFLDNPDADEITVAAAREYLEFEPGAIQGEEGRKPTYRIACRLIIDYALSTAQALELMEEWNRKCEPPWSTAELKQKLDSACREPNIRGSRNMAKFILEAKAMMESSKISIGSSPSGPISQDFFPFPVEVLPKPLGTFINAVAASIGCDPSFVALPVLATCAAAIGNTRTLVLKPGWSVPSILWCAVVGESGTQKSPAFKAAYKPLRKRQSRLLKEFREATAAFKANGASKDPPPVYERCLVSDTTVEALVPVLRDNWRGVFLARDELAGWVRSFDQYKKKAGASGDSSHWLSLYNGEAITVDRKSGEIKVIEVPQPALCICGGIQPGILNQVMGGEHREDGLLARLLISYPPRRQKRWTDESISQSVEAEYDNLISALFNLQAGCVEDNLVSLPVKLSQGALDIIKVHVDVNGEEQFGYTGELAAAWGKLEEIPARLALLIHCVRCVSGECNDQLVCDAESMEAAVKLTTWFKNEILRVYHLISESSEERQRRELVAWITKQGGRVRGRDLLTGRRAKSVEQAEGQLGGLVKAGYGKWEQSQNATGPTAREFVLSSQISNGLLAGSA